jgi:hypothetical protein
MRRLVLVFAAMLALSGCIALDEMYDDHARDECDLETTSSQRGACHDRVDQNRRDHP